MIIERNESRAGRLAEGEAHVWRIVLDTARVSDSRVLACLSAQERARQQRHRESDAGMRFALTRLALRTILSRYTGVAPAAVELRVDERGKPEMWGEPSVQFSLSHAPRLALIAVARGVVGIDIERARAPRRLLQIARRVLHPDTVATLAGLTDELRRGAFLDAWTQRESHVKAVGGGLFLTPDTLPFNVAQPPDGVPYRCRDRSGIEWSVARFRPEADTHAALVASRDIVRLRFFDWQPDPTGSGDDA